MFMKDAGGGICALMVFIFSMKKTRNFSHSAEDEAVAVVCGGLTRLLIVLNKVRGLCWLTVINCEKYWVQDSLTLLLYCCRKSFNS